MTGPSAVQYVSVDDWVAYDYPDPPKDEYGNAWIWQTISGWFGGIDVRGAPVDRPMIDGAYDGIAPFTGRKIDIGGTMFADSRAGLQAGMDALAAVLASQNRRSALIVDEGIRGLTRTADVRLGGATQIERKSTLQVDWSISLYASDPLRYGTTTKQITILPFQPGGGRVYNLKFTITPPLNRKYGKTGRTGIGIADNAGNAATPPIITFFGPSRNPAIRVVGGAKLQVMHELAANDVVIVDCGARTVTLGGANRRYWLSADSRWLTIPPGSTELYHWVDWFDGYCTVQWRDAWT